MLFYGVTMTEEIGALKNSCKEGPLDHNHAGDEALKRGTSWNNVIV